MSSKESFYYQIEFLQRYFKVVALDFPGFGRSEPPDTAFSVGDYAEWLKRFLDLTGADRADILAHSFGARVAFKLCAAYPERVKKLIITGGAGLVKPRSPQYIRRVNRYRRVKKLFPKFAERHFGSEEYRALSPLMRESYKKIVNEDLSSDCMRVKAETYLLYGENDEVTPINEEGKTFQSLIAGARLESMQGGHFCFSEYPRIFNKKIYSFLRET